MAKKQSPAALSAAQVSALQAILAAGSIEECRTLAELALGTAATTPVAARPRGMSTEALFDAWCEAKAAAFAACERWDLDPAMSMPAELTGTRSFKTARGATIRLPVGARIPAAQYWPGGRIPDRWDVAAPTRRTVAEVSAAFEAHWAAEAATWAMVRAQGKPKAPRRPTRRWSEADQCWVGDAGERLASMVPPARARLRFMAHVGREREALAALQAQARAAAAPGTSAPYSARWRRWAKVLAWLPLPIDPGAVCAENARVQLAKFLGIVEVGTVTA